jgi:hypothetical protein
MFTDFRHVGFPQRCRKRGVDAMHGVFSFRTARKTEKKTVMGVQHSRSCILRNSSTAVTKLRSSKAHCMHVHSKYRVSRTALVIVISAQLKTPQLLYALRREISKPLQEALLGQERAIFVARWCK